MMAQTTALLTSQPNSADQSDRRQKNRTPTIFTLLYSGMDSGQMLIADGVVTNLSTNGIGIRGNRSVTLGMELALFVDIPGMEEPLCMAQSRVSWVEGRRFGVELGPMKLEDMNHLGFFLWDHNSPSNDQVRSN